jgi:hypothetical protein
LVFRNRNLDVIAAGAAEHPSAVLGVFRKNVIADGDACQCLV